MLSATLHCERRHQENDCAECMVVSNGSIFIYVKDVVEFEVHENLLDKKVHLKSLLQKHVTSITHAHALMWQIHNVTQPSETSVMSGSKTLNV